MKRDRLRVAGVSYLNAAPLLYGLQDDPDLELTKASPAEVTRRMLEGEADVALLPVAAAATIGGLEFLDLGIASEGPVRSVVVVAQQPLHTIRRLVVDASSRTSVVLARLEFSRLGNLGGGVGKLATVVSMPPDEAIASVRGDTAALVIGDPAIDLQKQFPFGFDLAETYRRRTGLPFVFAAWVARAGVMGPRLVHRLHEAAEQGWAARQLLATTYAKSHGLDPIQLTSYLTDAIKYNLGDREFAGLRQFFTEAEEARLLPRCVVCPPLTKRHPAKSPRSAASGLQEEVADLLDRAIAGQRLSAAEGVLIAEHASLFELGIAADAIRKRKNKPDTVTYIVDRNVNYTNVCTTSCKFCAFYRPVGHEEGYVLSRDVLAAKLQEVVDAGGVQILLQGGLNPALRIEWYEDLFRWMKQTFQLGLHALSPEEILHLATLESLSVREVLTRLRSAGLDSVPGGGAEILVDRVRQQIAKAKCSSEEWLSVMRTAHQMGLRSSATMMYGTTDTVQDRVAHLIKLRDLQDETRGFTAFFCWDFQYERGTRLAPGEHGTLLYLRTQALARILLDNFDHIGASWVTQGAAAGQIALRFGADDWGSVMFEENVVSSAGTTFRMNSATVEQHVREAGFLPVRRNVRYEHLSPNVDVSQPVVSVGAV